MQQQQKHPGYRAVAYYVNWAIYGRNHQPQDLPADKLTHVLYAFANVRPESGEVYLTDPWSDTDKHYPTDSWNDTGTNLYGCLKQLFLLKKKHRHLKILLSIGGWTYSANFAAPASNPAGRQKFASSAVELVQNLGLDGLDIDWEYPANDDQAKDFVHLLAETRSALDAAFPPSSTKTTNNSDDDSRAPLTIACPAGPSNYTRLHLKEMSPHLSFFNLMAYDYAGSWDPLTAHQANLHPSSKTPASTPFSTSAAVRHYVEVAGIPASKIVIGMPLYGRVFASTEGLGSPFQGTGGEGSWETGVWDFKALPRPGADVFIDTDSVGASWSYDKQKRVLVSYDSVPVARMKAEWIRGVGLGGAMWWESSGDRAVAPADGGGGGGGEREGESLIAATVAALGEKEERERSENRLEFPESKYENLRRGFPGE